MSPTSATPTPSENGDHSHHRFSLREFMSSLITHKGKNKPDEVRNYLLVVATLIAAVTFQAGVNPPGGVWQDNSNNHRAGQAIYASNATPFYVFLTFNTLALSSSIFLMINLTWGFPFFLEVVIATVSMLITYGASIFAITPPETMPFIQLRNVLYIVAAPIFLRIGIQIFKYVIVKSGGQCNFYLG